MLGGIFDGIMDFLDGVVDAIGSAINGAIGNFFGSLFYDIVAALCKIVKLVYEFFSVFAGIKKVSYNGQKDYLINIFFGNSLINDIYWGMALIGIVITFAMLIIAVIRKAADINGKQQQSYGMMLVSAGKNILTILLMNAIMAASINITNVLIQQVSFIFDNAGNFEYDKEHKFTNLEFAAMARIYNTIGNYSLNSSYNSRYNLNSCYNEIREDLLYLQQNGVFDFYYDTENGETWQSALQSLIRSCDPNREQKIDAYTDTSAKMLELMELLRKDASFKPIEKISLHYGSSSGTASDECTLDRVIFLMGTLEAAKNNSYNKSPAITDAVRGPFYYGKQSIYNKNQVKDAFNIGLSGISYVTIVLMAYFTMKNLAICIFNCIARMFNLIGLYIIAPPIIATSPLDNGEKFKQWITSTVVQMFGVFGCIIPMRLVMIFIPVILDTKLVLLSESPTANILAKALLIVGSIEAANKFSEIVTGILANSAGYASVRAGDMSGLAGRTFSRTAGAIGSTVSAAANMTGVVSAGKYVGGKLMDAKNYMSQKGGLFIGGARGIYNLAKHETEGQIKSRQKEVGMKSLEESERKYGVGVGGKKAAAERKEAESKQKADTAKNKNEENPFVEQYKQHVQNNPSYQDNNGNKNIPSGIMPGNDKK